MRFLLAIIAITIIFTSCQNTPKPVKEEKADDYTEALKQMKSMKGGEAIALESMDAAGYTYIKMREHGNDFWAAVTARPIETGKKYYYADAMLMKDFESKELEKTFDEIYFIQNFSAQPIKGKSEMDMADVHGHTGSKPMEGVSVKPAEGGITLAELFGNKKKYEGKEVTVRGKVAKINRNIMQKNWIHIQDGTDFEGKYDLTVTSKAGENLQPGDIATFKGSIILNKDFGSGYKYEILMQDAQLVKHEGRKM